MSEGTGADEVVDWLKDMGMVRDSVRYVMMSDNMANEVSAESILNERWGRERKSNVLD